VHCTDPSMNSSIHSSMNPSRQTKRHLLTVITCVVLTIGLAACRSGPTYGGGTSSGPNSPGATGGVTGGMPTAGGTGQAPGASTDAWPSAGGGSGGVLAAPTGRARNWAEYKRIAAQRLVAANPGTSYTGRPPEPLLSVPVMQVDLNANGTVRRITVLRTPSQATDTIQLAINAINRAAPYGDVRHLPQPWQFSEAFLFDDNRRFKPRTLD
jgi:hypothetical protein